MVNLCHLADAQHAFLGPDNGKSISIGALVHQDVDEIEGLKMGPFVKLDNGNILSVDGTDCIISSDNGKTWENIRPTDIEASSAPAMLKRLQSGRLVLVWHRRFPEGTSEYPLSGGDRQWSEVAASNHREELSIAFSEDDGYTWSDPRVIAKIDRRRKMGPPLRRISYPYLFEINPGELWITTMQGGLRVKLNEEDFIQ